MELSEALRVESCHLTKFFFVMDAVDECPESEYIRRKILRELQKLRPNLRPMVTGWPYISNNISLFGDFERSEIRAPDSDIKELIQGQIEIDNSLRKRKDHLARDLPLTCLGFLWPSLASTCRKVDTSGHADSINAATG